MMMRIFFLVLILSSSNLFADCACERVSTDLAISQSDNIFSAKIKHQKGNVVTLEKLKVFKGLSFSTIEIAVSPCPIKLAVGASYVFFLKKPVVQSSCEAHFELKSGTAIYEDFLSKFKVSGM